MASHTRAGFPPNAKALGFRFPVKLGEWRSVTFKTPVVGCTGQQVEKWVGDSLKDEGFEVKSARTESVKMSSKQTQNALDKKENFLLCVVPIPENTDLNFETVRKNMRFIKNISKKFGDRVTELCEYIGGQEAVLTNDPDDTSPGVELEGEAGKAEIRVQKSVWESDEAFPLENLTEKLR